MTDTIGSRVKHSRLLRDLSQAALAKLADVEPSTIGNLEQGSTKRPTRLTEIARVLRVRPEWLATGQLPMEATVKADVLVSQEAFTLAQQIQSLTAPQRDAIRAMVLAFTGVEGKTAVSELTTSER